MVGCLQFLVGSFRLIWNVTKFCWNSLIFAESDWISKRSWQISTRLGRILKRSWQILMRSGWISKRSGEILTRSRQISTDRTKLDQPTTPIGGEQQVLVCFLVEFVENQFSMLKPVNQPASLWFWGWRPAVDRHRRRVDRFPGQIVWVGWVSRVPSLVRHSYLVVWFYNFCLS